MKAEIIAVGAEILLGDILNTNARFLSRQLAALGIDVHYQTVVGDNAERLKETVFKAFSRADLIITSGGLGPTEDDLTKEICAECLGKKLVLDKKALSDIEEFFNKIGRTMTENNVKQAYIPEGAIPLYNANGTAPGIVAEDKGKIAILLPGPPRELEPMFTEQVLPILAKKQEYVFVSKFLRVAAVGESAMEQRIKDIIDAQTNPTIAPYAKYTESLLRITAKAKNESEAQELIRPVAQKIRERFGDDVYAEGENATMQETVAKMLLDKKLTIATAESCTGGMIASWLVEYPGVSEAFTQGVVSYSNESKMQRLGVKEETLRKYGEVSAQTALEMAEGIAKTSGADIGVATTGIAGPGGGSDEKPVGLVYIGVSVKGETTVKERRFAGDRQNIRERAAFTALDILRRRLIKCEL